MRLLVVLVALTLVTLSCSSDDDSPTQSAPIEIADLLASTPRTSTAVTGYLIWNDAGARLCEALAESFPPQCGGASIVIANPESLTTTVEQEQTTRWTDEWIVITGTFDGTEFTIAN